MERDSKIIKIAILASGNGSNAENIIRFCQEEEKRIQVVCVVTDKVKAGVIARAQKLNVPCEIIPFEKNKETHEKKIITTLEQYGAEWICLAGYMRILSPCFLHYYTNSKLQTSKIVNIHPSLLPSFPGAKAYQDAFEANVKEGGVTIHFVDEGMDTGEHILQAKFPRLPTDTFEDFKQRGLELEYKLYREFLRQLAGEKVNVLH